MLVGENGNRDQEVDLSGLMRRGQEGDAAAYNALLQEISRPVRSFLRKKIKNPEEQEDLLQEILISLHNARHTYDPRRPFLPWLWAITRHRYVDYLRRRNRTPEVLRTDAMLLEEIQDPTPRTSFEIRDVIQRALARLPEKQRKALVLTKLKGHSIRDAAQVMKISSGDVRVNVHRAGRSLFSILKELGYEDG